jgi:hypothetical protein
MIKAALALFSLLAALSALGGERLAEIPLGTACESIPGIELKLGSVAVTGQDVDGISRYSGIHGGREAEIVYHCAGGSLTEQIVVVTTGSRDEAIRFAQAQKIALSNRLGKPVHDGLNLPTWRRLLSGILGADLDYLMNVVVWGRANEDVILQISETGADRWQVSISQGGSKLEYIINS